MAAASVSITTAGASAPDSVVVPIVAACADDPSAITAAPAAPAATPTAPLKIFLRLRTRLRSGARRRAEERSLILPSSSATGQEAAIPAKHIENPPATPHT